MSFTIEFLSESTIENSVRHTLVSQAAGNKQKARIWRFMEPASLAIQ